MDHNHHYLFGLPFKVVTNHHALCTLMKLKNPSNQLAHWVMKLQINFSIVYKTGKMHVDADSLSRNPLPLCDKRRTGDDYAFLFSIFSQAELARDQDEDLDLRALKTSYMIILWPLSISTVWLYKMSYVRYRENRAPPTFWWWSPKA